MQLVAVVERWWCGTLSDSACLASGLRLVVRTTVDSEAEKNLYRYWILQILTRASLPEEYTENYTEYTDPNYPPDRYGSLIVFRGSHSCTGTL